MLLVPAPFITSVAVWIDVCDVGREEAVLLCEVLG